MSLYIFVSDLPEHEELAEGFARFTDVRPSHPPLAQRQIVLVSFDGSSVHAIGCMRHKRRKVANYKWHVTIDELEILDDPLAFGALEEVVSSRSAQALNAARTPPGSQLTKGAADDVLNGLVQLRPTLRGRIDYLIKITSPVAPKRRIVDREPIVAYERDASGLALELAGLHDARTELLREWDGTEDEPFLRSTTGYTVLEDRALEHDARVFGDWALVKSSVVGVARFESRGRRVTIVNANRAGLEKALGVDLIYYTQEYNAYILVQYKRWLNDDAAQWTFRPDKQFDAEVARMRKLFLGVTAAVEPSDYRFDERCCFLKLCAPRTPDAFSSDLVRGAYLPLEYWDVLETSGSLAGSRGGRVLTHATVSRYLTNTDFINLVRSSWVGSRGVTSRHIESVVAAGLESNRSLILAVSTLSDTDLILPES